MPLVEVKMGLPLFSSCQSRALLPLLAARKIFSPAIELSLKYAKTYPSFTAALCRVFIFDASGITAAVADAARKARYESRRMMKAMNGRVLQLHRGLCLQLALSNDEIPSYPRLEHRDVEITLQRVSLHLTILTLLLHTKSPLGRWLTL